MRSSSRRMSYLPKEKPAVWSRHDGLNLGTPLEAACRRNQINGNVSLVYFLQRSDGLIKIGFSENVVERKQSLETGAGPLVLLAVIYGRDQEEAALHQRFVESRVWENHEWFHPSEDLLDLIKSANDFQSESASDVD